jgi:hypothetical protein
MEKCKNDNKPLWLVLLDNFPTLIMFILGAVIISEMSGLGAILYLFYSLLSIVWFWAKICPYCHYYDTFACPCGYGKISSKFFKKKNDKPFKKVFNQNIGVVFPNWFVPIIIALYQLLHLYTHNMLILTIIFCLIGFVIIPVISKRVGCKNCAVKENCPWMQKTLNK